MSLMGRWAVACGRKGIDLPPDSVHEIIDRHSAQEWFKTGFDLREKYYWNAWAPSFWLAKRLSSRARILETGCGCGLNLLWFAQHGFRRLYGFDIDAKAIAAARDLGRLAGVRIELWEDDALAPSHIPPEKFDCVLALNWTYLVEQFRIENLLSNYVPRLAPRGYLVFDVVDPSYASNPLNVYCTQDWQRPEEQRRLTEYPTRYAFEDIDVLAQDFGLSHLQTISFPQPVPKVVYIFGRGRGGGR